MGRDARYSGGGAEEDMEQCYYAKLVYGRSKLLFRIF